MSEIQKHIKLLGLKAEDKVTGFQGVISSMCFDLYGCIQASLTPPVNDKGERGEVCWYDVSRLKITDPEPVMDLPNFSNGYVAEGKKGCAEKPVK